MKSPGVPPLLCTLPLILPFVQITKPFHKRHSLPHAGLHVSIPIPVGPPEPCCPNRIIKLNMVTCQVNGRSEKRNLTSWSSIVKTKNTLQQHSLNPVDIKGVIKLLPLLQYLKILSIGSLNHAVSFFEHFVIKGGYLLGDLVKRINSHQLGSN